MKGRESAMPEESYWATFFDADAAMKALFGGEEVAGDLVEFGCGYGTFTLPAALHTRGTVTALDIDPQMVACVGQKARSMNLPNIRAEVRDFVAQGTGLGSGTQAHAMIFNLLHLEDPVPLLREALRVLRVGGVLSVIHWRSDIPTPRGPSLDIRPRPEQCRAWMAEAGFTHIESVDLRASCPFHFGLIAKRSADTSGGSAETIPLLALKDWDAPSVFRPENLMREARRQKDLPLVSIPEICIFDPDGDFLDHLRDCGRARRHAAWACYHTQMDIFEHEGITFGIIGRVVGASFAVLVAEELFVSGCKLLISVTSAGQITPLGQPPYVVLLERALRDEGTSYHYLPPARYSVLDPELRTSILAGWKQGELPLYVGASWTTDAPFRETASAIEAYRAEGIVAVEMEAAALYALAQARRYAIVCFAHVTNQMAQQGDDFEKGPDQGSQTVLTLVTQVAQAWRQNSG